MKTTTSPKQNARARRRKHIRKKVFGSVDHPRLVVNRTNKQIYAQIVDDIAKSTLISASTLTKELASDLKKASTKVERAKLVGIHIAKLAKDKDIKKVVFDRAGYLYHGRVKALAEGAREGGLEL